MNSGIYQIMNGENYHMYVGSAVDFGKRWNWHRSRLNSGKHHSVYLQRVWDKYGEGVFEFSEIEFVEKEDLISKEQFYLDLLKPEYNVSISATGGDLGSVVRKKLSMAAKGNKVNLGRKFSEEHKLRIGESNKGKRSGLLASEETKRKMSESHSGEKHHFYGKSHSEETKRKISETLKRKNIKEIN
jgi:group I intron endonuclease